MGKNIMNMMVDKNRPPKITDCLFDTPIYWNDWKGRKTYYRETPFSAWKYVMDIEEDETVVYVQKENTPSDPSDRLRRKMMRRGTKWTK